MNIENNDQEIARKLIADMGKAMFEDFDTNYVSAWVPLIVATLAAARSDGVDVSSLRGVDKLARLMAWHYFGLRWDQLEKRSKIEVTAACQAALGWMNRPLVAREKDVAVLAAVEEALFCLLGKGERLSPIHFSAYGDPEWEATDLPPLQTGMHVHMKLTNGHLCSPLLEAWSENVKQAAIALMLARDTLKGTTDGSH